MSGNSLATKVTEGLWRRQFDPELDFPTVDVAKKVALCTTPRCGSHFLGHLLHATGAFGYPLEYLNPGNWEIWRKRSGRNRALDYVKSVRTGPNGVFSIKLHHEHLSAFLDEETEPLDYRFIHLRRRDLIGQAVSFARAQQTGSWISDMPETAPASYDYDLITAKVDAISRGNADWQSFLCSVGIEPLRLYYEDVLTDTPAAITQIARYLDIDLTDAPSQAHSFAPRRQKTGQKDEWSRRFTADSRAALVHGRSVAGTADSAPPRRWRGHITKMKQRLIPLSGR